MLEHRVRTATGHSRLAATAEAVREALALLLARLDGARPSLVLTYATPEHDLAEVAAALADGLPDVPVAGGVSHAAVITGDGFHPGCVALFGLCDPAGAFGVGGVDGGDPAESAALAVRAALEQAGRLGEQPSLVWLVAAPGTEERALAGIASVVGAQVPVFGGSSSEVAPSLMNQLVGARALSSGVALAVLFVSCELSFAFQSGYEPTGERWLATSADGRLLHELDGRPAAEVYDAATGGAVLAARNGADGDSVLARSTLAPLGRLEASESAIDRFVLAVAVDATATGGLKLLAEVAVGETLHLMTGSREALVRRPSRVVRSAFDLSGWASDGVAGALVAYCAGCLYAVEDRAADLADRLSDASCGAPLLALFSRGEQGSIDGARSRHGNLMVAAVLFGAPR